MQEAISIDASRSDEEEEKLMEEMIRRENELEISLHAMKGFIMTDT